MNRTVRRCLLLGDDPVSGKNSDRRKLWLDDQLIHQALFGDTGNIGATASVQRRKSSP